MIDYFAGVIIWTDNLNVMVRFYRDTLELPVHSLHADFAAFDLGGTRLSVGLHAAVHGPARDRERIMVNLGVDDVQAAFRTLTGRGVEFIRSPEREHWGGWIATLSDPDDNLLQLLQTRAM